jgi:hypothetical protein
VVDHVFVVLSEPPAGLPEDEINSWYDLHVRQILALPGFVAAERFALRFVRGSAGEAPGFTYYVRYEIEGDFDRAWMALREAVDSGRMDIPDWLSQVRSAGWEGSPLGGRVVAGEA